MNYYNENNPYCAQWLRNLIHARLIPEGHVDTRDIRDVTPDDLVSYTQCHFFAGIAGWPRALALASVSPDRPLWTGSCPCQSFSAAGARGGAADDRHLWPHWFYLIRVCKPPTVLGEQVAAAIGMGWLDAVFSDLESQGYACGAAVLPACSVGAPHIRQRLWFVGHADVTGREAFDSQSVRSRTRSEQLAQSGLHGSMADADGRDASTERLQRGGEHGQQSQDGGVGFFVGNSNGEGLALGERDRRVQRETMGPQPGQTPGCGGDPCFVEHTPLDGRQQRRAEPGERGTVGGRGESFWSDAEWIACIDGKWRPTEPGSFPLAHGVPQRVAKLRALGNAIVGQTAAEFIKASL